MEEIEGRKQKDRETGEIEGRQRDIKIERLAGG